MPKNIHNMFNTIWANGKNKASTKSKNESNAVKLKNSGRITGGVKTGDDGNSNIGGGSGKGKQGHGKEGHGRFK